MSLAVLNAVATRVVALRGYLDQLSELGISYHDWPECNAKDLVRSFVKLKAERTEHEARLECAPKTKTLNQKASLPDNVEEFISLYDRSLEELKVQELIRSLTLDSGSARDHVDKFLGSGRAKRDAVNLHDPISLKEFAEWKRLQTSETLCKKISDFEKISELIGGFNPQRLSMLVAESGMGKTTLAMAITSSVTKTDAALFINMEMGLNDMFGKHIRAVTGTTYRTWVEEDEVQAIQTLSRFADRTEKRKPLLITSGKVETVQSIESLIRSNIKRHKITFVVIDYDQKIANQTRDEEWRALLKTLTRLEQIAIQFGIHIMILAQGNEEGIPKASKRSIQPVSSILWFYEKNERYFLTANKNRFGKHKATLELNVNMKTGEIDERVRKPNPLYPVS